MSDKFGYYINLEERGEFYADVRDAKGNTIYEIRSEDGEVSPVEDGFMKDTRDVDGLTGYLTDLGVIPAGSEVLEMSDFESALEAENENGPEGP